MHTRPNLASERGIALVVAVFAMVVIGALVAGVFLLGRLELQMGRNSVYAVQAQEAAEAGLTNRIQSWDPLVYNGMTAGDTIGAGYTTLGGQAGFGFADTVIRMNKNMFLIKSTGTRASAGGQPLASRSVAGFMRLSHPTVSVNAAVTVTDPIQFNGNAFGVTGYNDNPPAWGDCDPTSAGTEDDVVGVRSSNGTGVENNDLDNVDGYPAAEVSNDPTITSQTFRDFLDYTYNTLVQQPNVKVLPDATPYQFIPVEDATTSPASCDRTELLNMGEPTRDVGSVASCYGYFPVAHGTANRTKMASNTRGQGTLLIDGDLELNGGFEWNGVIIVRGSINIAGTGNKIYGAVLAESVTEDNTISGNVEIRYSSCAIEKAVAGASYPTPLRTRGWVTVSQ